ncbi:MAG TPA: AAA family ATPase, partial [Chthoniobacterales bacterium]|nr:AAA family ATPase [Chthoniobacterales bacterium]
EAVKGRLEREKNDGQPKAANPFLHRFPRDAVIYPRIETLGASTSIPELEAYANVTAEEKESLQGTRDRVEALQPRSADSRLQVATSDRELYGALRNATQSVASFEWEKYDSAVADACKVEARYVAASKTAFAGEDIPVIFGDAWKAFIVAGEAYLRESGAHEHPTQGDQCPYCRQGLGAKAVALVQKYRDFCNNEPKKTLDSATATVKRLAAPVALLQINAIKASCEQRRANFTDASAFPPLLAKAVTFLAQFERRHADVSAGRAVTEGSALSKAAAELSREAGDAAAKAEGAIADLRKQADERKKELETESAKLRLLENRLTLNALLSEVRSYVERAQWAARAAPLVNRTTAVLRSLTEQSKLASKELLDKDFERLFETECNALRAPKVQLDFAGRKGQAARKKTLVPEHRLSEILSEGEQKVIALADFLAEASLHRTAAPVVFDDPVNSLDYKRLQYVVDRVVELSATRQVIVFTHNIWFAAEILSRFDKATTGDCTYYGVAEANGSSGIVTRGSHPRWDTVAKLAGRINQLMHGAGTAMGEAQASLVESAYGNIRSWCEVVVEQELLAGVTQRYQPNVAMTKLPHIKPAKFVAARDVILPLFEKACRVMSAHSQPLETLAIRPTLAELKTDWSAAQQARDAYLK